MYKYEVKELIKEALGKAQAQFAKELAKRDKQIKSLEQQVDYLHDRLENLDPEREVNYDE
jgi:hypothetical protein